MNDSSEFNEVLESVIFLFVKTLYDFNPYLKNPDEQERLIDMPNQLKKVLREIISSEIFTKLIFVNESRKAEEKARQKALRKEERKRQLIEGIKSLNLQDENYENNLKLLKNKRSLNTSCFNQRSISTLNQYYNSVNEMMCIKNSVLFKIKKIESESILSCIELEQNNKIIHNKFIFINPNKKDTFLQSLNPLNKSKSKFSNESKFKSSITSGNILGNDLMLSRGFMSLDNYYKFIKKKLEKINDEQKDIKDDKYKKRIKLDDDEEKKSKKEMRIKVYNTETKEILPSIKKFPSANKNRMNYVLLNKDIKYQFKRTNFANNNKKFVNKEKLQYLPYQNFDYTNILSLFK
jgi:hypothetical protein